MIISLISQKYAASQDAELEPFLYNVISSSNHKSFYVLPITLLGFANRMRILAGFYAIAVQEKRHLIVLWQPTTDCDAAFHEIFEETDKFSVYSFPRSELSTTDIESDILKTLVKVSTDVNIFMKFAYPRKFLYTEPLDREHDRVISLVWTRAIHAPAQLSCQENYKAKSRLYKQLKPVKSIQDNLFRFKKMFKQTFEGFFSTVVVGVHIRAYDERYDWRVVTPPAFKIESDSQVVSPDGTVLDTFPGAEAEHLEAPAERFDQASPLVAFESIMTSILEQRKNIRFYVSSNSPELRTRLKDDLRGRWGPNTIMPNPSDEVANPFKVGDRSSLEGIHLAVMDFILLSETDYILHSRGSSFAKEAAAIRSIPLIDVTTFSSDEDQEPLGIVTQVAKLPYCGASEYHRALSPLNTKRVCYDESFSDHETGKANSRSMCTTVWTLCRCQPSQLKFMLPNEPGVKKSYLSALPMYCPVDPYASGKTGSSKSKPDLAECLHLPAESNGHSL